jgi:hypothetical protein
LKRWTNNTILAALAGALCVAAAQGALPPETPATPATNAPPDGLLLRNGDLVNGKLLAIDSRRGIRWKHLDVAAPIEFKLDSASRIYLHPPPAPSPSGDGTNLPCKVFLARGDVLPGNLVSCNRETLCLQTWYAGQLIIPRKSLQAIYFPPLTPDSFVLAGPEGWTQGTTAAVFPLESGQWTYRDGAFYASKAASIARDLKLPPTADIQFDLAWSGDLALSVALYTDSLQPLLIAEKDNAPDFGGFYSMRFQNMLVDLMRIKKRENPVISLSAVVVPAFTQTNRVHIQVRALKQSNTIALSVDGQRLQVWTDPKGFVGEGAGMRFVHNGPGLVKVSNLRVAPWDGVWEEGPSSNPLPGQDIVWLTNAATMTGVLESVAGGKMTLRGNRDKAEVPLSRVRRIAFPPLPDEPPKAMEGLVRATFAQGGSLTFQLESWSPEGVNLRSPIFGPAKFNPDAFKQLGFLSPEGGTPEDHPDPNVSH